MAETRWCTEGKPLLAMVAVEVAFAIVNVLIKQVLDEGVVVLVFVTYRFIMAALFLAPISHLRERKTRPKLTTRIFWHLFFCALSGGTLTQFLFLLGLKYTSATFTCAFINMVPVATFLMALPFRLETANLKSRAGRAKVLGTAVSVSGAMVLTLYQGVALTNRSHSPPAVEHVVRHERRKAEQWTMGSVILVGACLSWSSWFLLQAKIGKSYPALYSTTAATSFLSALQSGILAFATERKMSSWALKRRLHILSVVYSGAVGSGLCFVVMAWCVKKRGPLFTAAFSPLIQIIVAIIDISFLKEWLHLGNVLGSLLVIVGLYILLWGKSTEAKMVIQQLETNDQEAATQAEAPQP